MGLACTMARVLQTSCGVVPPPPPPPKSTPCEMFHPDNVHHMTWIVDEVPSTWVLPITFEYSDGFTEVSADGTDAHEFASPGSYTIKATDASGRTCTVTVAVPT
jgi:hypothetical protein